MDLTEHLRLIFQRKWLVLGASLAVALLVFGWRTTQPKTWSAASLIDVVASGGQQSTTATEESVLFTSKSYAELATTRPVLARAGAAVQPPLDLPTVEQRAKTSSTRAGYIDIVVTGPTPAAATQLADALAQAIVDTVANRQSQQSSPPKRRSPSWRTDSTSWGRMTSGARPCGSNTKPWCRTRPRPAFGRWIDCPSSPLPTRPKGPCLPIRSATRW